MRTDRLIITYAPAPVGTDQTSNATNPPQCRRRGPAEQILGPRDVEVLCWLAEQYAARVDQLQVLLGCRERQAQRVVARLRAHGLVWSKRLTGHEPPWVTPTALGLQLTHTGFRLWAPGLTLLAHTAAVNDVRLHIQSRSPSSVWTSERQLAREKGTRGHLPDAVVLTDGQRVAIEVELTPKSKRRTIAIINGLCASYDTVLYFVSPQVRANLTKLTAGGRWPKLGIRELPTIVGERS